MKKLIMLALSAVCTLAITGTVSAADDRANHTSSMATSQTCMQHESIDDHCMSKEGAAQAKSDKAAGAMMKQTTPQPGSMMMKQDKPQQDTMMMKKNEMKKDSAEQ